ncbi:MAG TPA: HlyD family efflux transporter periplasmic adaptor subunit [Anaerolineae bacterium]|nr:HlyD family efflux transporter periplasmic adaptor subunit [Anaerolineae bacterium]
MFSRISRKHLIIAFVFIFLISVGGFAYYRSTYLTAQTADEEEIQTSVVRRGDLIIYASGSGTLIAANEKELGFGANGPVAELNVQVGDEVKAGDVLAVQGDREQLEAAVAADQLSVMNAQKALDDLDANADLVAAQAQLDLANARDELSSAQYARAAQQAGNRATQLTIEDAYADLVVAENKLQNAKDEYEKLLHLPETNSARMRALSNYLAAQQVYNSALREYNWYIGQPSDIDQALFDAEVALAQAKVAEAEREYERLKDGPDPDEVAMAELQLTNAKAALAVSQRNLEESTIVAPMDGTILAITAEVGDNVSGSFITLADLSQLYLDIYLDEADLDKIHVDYEAEVTFDALPDFVFTGHVVQVNPSLYTSGPISTIKGLVKLDESPTLTIDNLLLGMNAAVDVIAGRAEGVAMVPVEALHELSPGEYAVFVMQNGELKLRYVEVGLNDLTFAEIKSGLEVGEVVTTGIVETQ